MPSPSAIVSEVREHGFSLQRGMVPVPIVNTILGPMVRNLHDLDCYASFKHRVLRLDIVPKHDRQACIVPEVSTVFTEALGANGITIQEIYLAPPGHFLPHPWHQDANEGNQVYHFMVWIAATPCGMDAPGLTFIKGNPGKFIGREIGAYMLGREMVSPVFEPGDAVFFDTFTLHKTNIIPNMKFGRVAYKLGAKAI